MLRMSLTIDHSKADSILLRALQEAKSPSYKPTSLFSTFIKEIINGDHLTYRYILVTALLAKSIDNRVNPLVIQAGSNLEGAYDARSLCHAKLVPFERAKLSNAFGGSNEPYLNKPARYKELSTKNAVRAGSDRRKLVSLCEFLPKITSQELAFNCLTESFYYSKERHNSINLLLNPSIKKSPERYEILNFINDLITDSAGGESCAIAVGGIFSLMTTFHDALDVRVHPVNQSGSSTKEVSDVDVYSFGNLVYTCEVKDKICSLEDVDHAIAKVSRVSFESLIFATGNYFSLSNCNYQQAINHAKQKGVFLTFTTIPSLAESIMSIVGKNCNGSLFYKGITKASITSKCTDRTIIKIEELAKKYNWIE